MKIYKLYLGWPIKALYIAMPPLMLAFLAVPFLQGPHRPPIEFMVPFVGGLAYVSYKLYRIPFEIRVEDDGKIQFRSLLRMVTVAPHEIKAIRAKPYQVGFVDIEHRGGFVHLVNQMDGFHEFLTNLKTTNPSIEIKGC
jgi:hypothetical protein